MRILIISQWFDPEPTFKGLAFARYLVGQGHSVEVLTGFPNYPGGSLYPGYRVKIIQRESAAGVSIIRVPLYPSHSKSVFGRIANYLSFGVSSAVAGILCCARSDVIYAYHPPLTVAMSAVVTSGLRRVPLVLDIQDMWPDTLRATGMLRSERALRAISKICCWVYRRADHLVVLSPGFKRLLLDRGVPEEKVDVIYNWSAESALASNDLADVSGTFVARDSRFKVLFAGNMGTAQALSHVIDAAVALERQGENVVFWFLGGGVEVEALKERARVNGLQNVVFFPAVPMDEVGPYLRAADALLVHLRNDPLFEVTIPSKTQAYMAMGKPIVMGVRGDAARLVSESECGVLAVPENAESIAGAILSIARLDCVDRDRLGRNACDYYRRELSLAVGAGKFLELFQRLIERQR